MTCIAWRNGIMACDSCWDYNDTQVVSAVKIHRLTSGALLGTAGDNDSRAMVELLDKIKDPKKLPPATALVATRVSFMGLLAFPKGGVWTVSAGKVDEQGYPTDDDEDYGVWPATTMGGYATAGSGSDYALTAMDAHHTVTAARAVELACWRNLNCRPPVWTCKLWPVDSKPKIASR